MHASKYSRCAFSILNTFKYVYVGALVTPLDGMCVAAALTAFIFIHSFPQYFQRRNTACFRPSTASASLAAHSHAYKQKIKKRSTTTATAIKASAFYVYFIVYCCTQPKSMLHVYTINSAPCSLPHASSGYVASNIWGKYKMSDEFILHFLATQFSLSICGYTHCHTRTAHLHTYSCMAKKLRHRKCCKFALLQEI